MGLINHSTYPLYLRYRCLRYQSSTVNRYSIYLDPTVVRGWGGGFGVCVCVCVFVFCTVLTQIYIASDFFLFHILQKTLWWIAIIVSHIPLLYGWREFKTMNVKDTYVIFDRLKVFGVSLKKKREWEQSLNNTYTLIWLICIT